MINKEERAKLITELQTLAERVRELKEQHRQRHPIVIEFSGSPKAGKTSCINSLEHCCPVKMGQEFFEIIEN